MGFAAVTTAMAGAINYTYWTDNSTDWGSIPTSTYFYDKADKLVHYKDSAGNIQEIFSGSGITVGTTPVTSGTDGRVFFQAGGVVQQDAEFLWDTTNKRMQLLGTGVIASPALNSVLEIKAKNGLSDIVFRVRNSTDTRNFLTVNGAGDVFNNGAQGVISNTFYGENSGRSATGLYNCFFGLTAGRDNSTGANNSFFGVEAGRTNTSGSSNSFFGIQAGTFNTTGGNNSFFGGGAGYNNGGGSFNAFFGNGAGSGNTSGSYNSCFGFAAGEYNSTGSENVFIGDETGRRTSTNANVTVANNSIFIGVLARANANSESNQIVIGHSATGLGSNTTVIGNSSTTLFRPYGNVAIGANTASATLDVRAQGALSTDIAFRVRNSADTGNHITVYGNDNVSIGRNGSASSVLFVRSANASAHDVLILQNGLYGDPLFRVRDNATGSQSSTCSFFMNGRIYGGNNTTKGTEFDLGGFGIGASYGDNGSNAVWLNNQGNVGDGSGSSVISVSSNFYINKQTTKVYKFEATSGNFGIGQMTFGTSATNTISIANGTAPTTSPSDAYQQYSADITAGNAAPHFRTENGAIVKVYQETTAVAAATLVSNAGTNITDTDTFDGYTLKQIVKALRNQGLLA